MLSTLTVTKAQPHAAPFWLRGQARRRWQERYDRGWELRVDGVPLPQLLTPPGRMRAGVSEEPFLMRRFPDAFQTRLAGLRGQPVADDAGVFLYGLPPGRCWILLCPACSFPDCGGISMLLTMEERTVRWSSFAMTSVSDGEGLDDATPEDLCELIPLSPAVDFTFDRGQYMAELAHLAEVAGHPDGSAESDGVV